MYAIIKDGGHQYRVEQGARLHLQLHTCATGDTITFDKVCLISDGEATRVGTPFLDGAQVTAKVTNAEKKGKKLHVRTYRRRKGTRRHLGHRQRFTEVEITGISG